MSFADRMMHVLTVSLAFVLAFVCTAAGIAFALWQNPKSGQLASAIAADVFLTLGVTALVGALSTCFPRVPVFRAFVDRMLTKLCVLGISLGLVFLVILIIL